MNFLLVSKYVSVFLACNGNYVICMLLTTAYQLFCRHYYQDKCLFGCCSFNTGIDSEGHAANFVETEQIVQYNNYKASFVQVSQTAEIPSHPAVGKSTNQ